MYKCVKVAVDKATVDFDKMYDYYIPQNMDFDISPGCRVTVPFGGYNKRRMALVMEVFERSDRENIKPVSTQVDRLPILNREGLELVLFLKKYTFCTYFDAVKALIPSGAGMMLDSKLSIAENYPAENLTPKALKIVEFINSKKNKVNKKELCKALNITENDPDLEELIEKGIISETKDDRRKIQDEKALMARLKEKSNAPKKLTEKQKPVIEMLKKTEAASIKEICYFCGVTKGVLTNLEKKGYIEFFEQDIYRNPYNNINFDENMEIVLNDDQKNAYEKLKELSDKKEAKIALLYGVTGSGKTSVFMKLIEYVIGKGENVIVMVPEIALTHQTVSKFQRLFGEKTAVLHSSLTMAQRLDEWKRIREGGARIVIGTRSAVFAPMDNIGLIVMDEEHERTYKSEISPRFHAKDVAAFRCKYHNALLLLASATPSIESYYNAQNNKYTLIKLTERFKGASLPDVYIVDMRESIAESTTSGISQTILEEICINLQRGEQSILLLNRRGYNTMIKCSGCGEAVKCPNCSVPLNYHSDNNRIMCHYCGYSSQVLEECPSCGSKMIRYTGVGTQRAEQQLRENFPEAGILRMDMDTTMTREAYEKSFDDFAKGKYDIMIGTQMVAKGLDFPNVTLVGVITADQALFSQNFRGYERAFSLITQVVGRGGRGNLRGRAYIQTSMPDNRVIELASKQNYEEYYSEEIIFRKLNLYPPFCKITCIGFTSDFEDKLPRATRYCSQLIRKICGGKYPGLPVRTLSPVPAEVYKVSGKYRYNMLIKHSHKKEFYDMLWDIFETCLKASEFKGVNMYIDTNYEG